MAQYFTRKIIDSSGSLFYSETNREFETQPDLQTNTVQREHGIGGRSAFSRYTHWQTAAVFKRRTVTPECIISNAHDKTKMLWKENWNLLMAISLQTFLNNIIEAI